MQPISSFDNSRPGFVGRKAELSTLSNAFSQGTKVAVIQGSAGSGKTSLATVFAEQHRDLFPNGVFHVAAHGVKTTQHLTEVFPAPPKKPALLVINDAESLDASDIHQLNTLLSLMPEVRAILTTRKPVDLGSRKHLTVSLGNLSREEAEELLSRYRLDINAEGAEQLYGATWGNVLILSIVAGFMKSSGMTWRDYLAEITKLERSGIVGINGQPLKSDSPQQQRIIVDARNTNDEILELLKEEPAMMRALKSREFEQMIAELLARRGYTVELTPATRDGGVDIFAAKKEMLGSFLYLVECKQYGPSNHVGVEIVRSLYGVLQSSRATAGMVVTSSFFTSGAKEFQQKNFHQMHLHDYTAVYDWLKNS